MNSKKYNNIKLIGGITKAILTFALLLFFIISGFSSELYERISLLVDNEYMRFLFFVLITGAGVSFLFSPLNYYLEFYIEHKYNLSNQSFKMWLWENTKGAIVGLLIGVPILLLFFFVLRTFENLWWLPFSIAMFIISVLLAKIVPTVILPIFYKVTPIDDEELKDRIIKLSSGAGMTVKNVFKFDMSKNTKKANAAFAGLGKTKRIILGDTLLENYSKDEIETVIAHELGHYKHKHIIKNIFIGTAASFLTFFLMAYFYKQSLSWFGFAAIIEVPALPLLILWGMIIGLAETPITNFISRKYEYEADDYAVSSTQKKDAFINTLNKLTDQNLGDKEPHPFVEWYFYSHPSIKKRTAHILASSKK